MVVMTKQTKWFETGAALLAKRLTWEQIGAMHRKLGGR